MYSQLWLLQYVSWFFFIGLFFLGNLHHLNPVSTQTSPVLFILILVLLGHFVAMTCYTKCFSKGAQVALDLGELAGDGVHTHCTEGGRSGVKGGPTATGAPSQVNPAMCLCY